MSINNNFDNINIPLKRSERIYNNEDKLLKSITKTISQKISLANNLYIFKEKITHISYIYELVTKNFKLLCSSKKCTGFFYNMMKKKEEIELALKKEIEKGSKLKTFSKKIMKILDLFEDKFIESYFNNMKSKTNLDVNDCPICLETIIKKDKVTTNCSHCFHKKCLFQHILNKDTCPICRSILF